MKLHIPDELAEPALRALTREELALERLEYRPAIIPSRLKEIRVKARIGSAVRWGRRAPA